MDLYNEVCFETSRITTKKFSTSFYTASLFFDKEIRKNIFNIYGFVRLADEIVDTFHQQNQIYLLEKLENDLKQALNNGLCINPILNSFVHTVKKYNIPYEYIDAFLYSMKLDLQKKDYSDISQMNEYVHGSAEVVGLMCLKVFCEGDDKLFENLKEYAIKLGAAFQKVNFLRDLKYDLNVLGRRYFPLIIKNNTFDEMVKAEIIKDIESDFKIAYEGILKLPKKARTAVLIAYWYYFALLEKIKKLPAHEILSKRIRISNLRKLLMALKVYSKLLK